MFDTMDASDLNKRLKDLMDGLSVKVRLLSPDASPWASEALQLMTTNLLTCHNTHSGLVVTSHCPLWALPASMTSDPPAGSKVWDDCMCCQ